jgi:O-antigen ligase
MTSLFAAYRRVAFRELRTVILASGMLYLMIRCQVKDMARLRRLARILWLSAVAVALYGLFLYPFSEGVIEAEGVRRARAYFGSPNNLALYLERTFPLGLALALMGRSTDSRRLNAIGALAVLGAVLLTFSRGAWLLALPAGTLFVLSYAMKGRALRVVLVVAVLLAAALAVTGLLPDGLVPDRMAALLNLGQGTTALRLKLWRGSLEMLRDHPWRGVGLDNFLYYYGDYLQAGAEGDRWLSHPHNLLLDFWLRLGLGGVAVLAALVIGATRVSRSVLRSVHNARLFKSPEKLRDLSVMTVGMVGGLLAALLHGMVDAAFFVVELALWLGFALAWLQQAADLVPGVSHTEFP